MSCVDRQIWDTLATPKGNHRLRSVRRDVHVATCVFIVMWVGQVSGQVVECGEVGLLMNVRSDVDELDRLD
jgi:hypothetical protein